MHNHEPIPTETIVPRCPIGVAVIDTGIDVAQLQTNQILPGINLSGEGEVDNTTDCGQHGSAIVSPALIRLRLTLESL